MPLKAMFMTAVSDTWDLAADGDPVGSIRWEHDSDGWKCFKCIQYDTGAGAVAAVVGDAAYYYGPGGGHSAVGYDTHQVTSDLSDSAEIGAGILQAIIPDGDFGWVQIKGLAAMTSGGLFSNPADGDLLTPTGASDGKLDTTAAATSHVCAICHYGAGDQIICDFPY